MALLAQPNYGDVLLVIAAVSALLWANIAAEHYHHTN